MLWRFERVGLYPALQGIVDSWLYKEPSYKDGGLLPKGTIITVMAKAAEKQEEKNTAGIIYTDSDGISSFFRVMVEFDYSKTIDEKQMKNAATSQ